MPFNIHDRVIPVDPETIRAVGEDNIGTITHIFSDEWSGHGHYEVQWDYPGLETYEDTYGPNQWNVSFDSVELYNGKDDFSSLDKSSKHYKICKKVLQMSIKRKAKGYVF